MITANLQNTMNWDAFRQLTLIPELARKMIAEQGYEKDAKPAKAIVRQGRWVVLCECGGAELAWDEGWFMCRSCFNSAHGHKYRSAIFPPKRKDIEKTLLVRPLDNRNWNVGETVAWLEIENAAHASELLGGN